ncbi:MAG: nucleotidyltransferase domain-containing protein [archaeon]
MLEKYALIKAIRVLTSEPMKSFSVRGLARETCLSPGATRTALDYMRNKGIACLKIIGKTYQYRADLENPLCRQWKILFNLDKIADSRIVEQTVKKMQHPISILLYGSFAKGTNDEKSDIDLLVISSQKAKTDFGFTNKLGKETNFSLFSLSDWKKKAVEDKVFYENVIYDSIVLFGEKPVVT